MTTAPNLVVAGHPGLAGTLRETGRFRAVFEAASATQLRQLSKGGQVTPPAAFMFAPGFVEDLPGATVAVLANGLAASGFVVLAHSAFTQQGHVFSDRVHVPDRLLTLEELLGLLGVAEPPPPPPPSSPEPLPAPPPASAPSAPLAFPNASPAPALPSQEMSSYPPSPVSQPPPPVAPQPPPMNPWPYPMAPEQAPNGESPPSPPEQTDYAFPPTLQVTDFSSPPAQVGGFSSPPSPVADFSSPPAPVAGFSSLPSPVAGFSGPPGQEAGLSHPSGPMAATQSGGWPAQQWPSTEPHPPPAAPRPRKGRVIAIASAKGGVGKTSTVVNLSVFASRILREVGREGSVVLVDTNFQQADVARYLNLDSPTVLDLFRASGTLSAESVRSHLAYVPEVGLYALLGPPDAITADPALINSTLYQRILAVLREAFDYVFIDTPVAELYHTTFSGLILPEADALLVPIEPNRVTLEAARAWLRAITLPRHARGGGVDPQKLFLVLNRARTDVNCSPEDVMDLMPGWRFVGMIPDDEEWMQAVNDHRLLGLNVDPAMDLTLRSILQVLTEDPVFAMGTPERSKSSPMGRLKKLLGLTADPATPVAAVATPMEGLTRYDNHSA